MKNSSVIGLIAAVAVLLIAQSASAQTVDVATVGDNGESLGNIGSGANDPIPQTDSTGGNMDTQIAALLAVIRKFESNDQYNILYGGGTFFDYSHHPDVLVPINLPGYEGKYSTAAGAYQINFPTYNEFAPQIGVTDFSPATQDALAIAILNACGAIDALANNDIESAFTAASSRWASLPGSRAGQHPQAMDSALTAFTAAGGTYV